MGVDKEGSEAFKVYHEEGNNDNEVFTFRSTGRNDVGNRSCSISMEYVKEIGELIGVSWAKAESRKKKMLV